LNPTLDLNALLNIVPQTWFGNERRIHVACYQTLRRPSLRPIPEGTFELIPVFVFERIVAYFYEGSISSFMPIEDEGLFASHETGFSFSAAKIELHTSPVRTWFIVVQPFYRSMSVTLVMKRLQSTAAMCALIYGRGLLHRLYAATVCRDEILGANSKTVTEYTHGPFVLYGSYLEDAPIAAMIPEYESFTTAYQRLSNQTRKRLDLALQWYERATHHDGIASFLDIWIALEVAVAPTGKCLSGIDSLLAQQYSITREEASIKFKTSELYTLRNSIVHGGFIEDVPPFIVDYVGLLFRDVIRAILDQPLIGYAAHGLARQSAKGLNWATFTYDSPSGSQCDHEVTCVSTVERTR